jgi:hypothetical protein
MSSSINLAHHWIQNQILDIDEITPETPTQIISFDEFLKLSLVTQKPGVQQNFTAVGEPDEEEYAVHVARTAEDEEIDALDDDRRLFEQVRSLFGRLTKNAKTAAAKIKRQLDRRRRFKGFSQEKPALPSSEVKLKTFKYVPGELPTLEEYKALGCPKIKYAPNQRFVIWKEAAQKGIKHLLDVSPGGSGKTHCWGKIKTDELGVKQLWYLSNRPGYPTCKPIEDWHLMPPRHGGLVEDQDRLTPYKEHPLRWPQNGETPTIPGNCIHACKAAGMRDKRAAGNFNEIFCKGGCKLGKSEDSYPCAETPGYYIFERIDVLKSPKIRSHPTSAPGEDFNWSKCAVAWDEFDELFSVKQDIEINQDEANRTWNLVELRLPKIFNELQSLRSVMNRLYLEDLKIHGRYGLDHYQFSDLIEVMPDTEQLNSMAADVRQACKNDIIKALKESGSDDVFRRALHLEWLPEFLEVLSQKINGYISFKNGQFTLSIPDLKNQEIIRGAKINLYLDATGRPEQVASKLGIKPDELMVICEDGAEWSNLTIIRYDWGRHIDKSNRSEEMQRRIAADKQRHKDQYGDDIGFFEFKASGEAGDLKHFSESRGSNEFKGKEAIASYGDPFMNMGDAAAEYACIHGIIPPLPDGTEHFELDPEFQAFYNIKAQAIIEQEVYRLRSNRRRNEQLTYYYNGNFDLSFLKDRLPGIVMTERDIFEDCHEAGTVEQRSLSNIIQLAESVRERGDKITQSDLADGAGISQGRISQIASKFGGWRLFKKLLAPLFNSLYRSTNNFDGLDEFEIQIAKTVLKAMGQYDPETMVEELGILAQSLAVTDSERPPDRRTFYKIFRGVDAETVIAILSTLLSLMPKSISDEFQQEILQLTPG